MAEPQLMRRRDLMDGYILAPTGATVGDAVRTADISNPQNRQNLERKGNIILTKHNGNVRPGDLATQPPTLEDCEMVVKTILARKEQAIADLQEQLKEAREEVKDRDLKREERQFYRGRLKSLERKLEALQSEQVTPHELYAAFVREDVSLRARDVPDDMRAAFAAIERERNLNREIASAVPAAVPGDAA